MGRNGIRDFERGFGKSNVTEITASGAYLKQHGISSTNLARLKPRAIRWQWPGWIPCGGLTFLCGDPGVGKSVLLVELMAIMSHGRWFPDGSKAARPNIVYYGFEDNLETVVIPRLIAAGADRKRISVPRWESGFDDSGKPRFKGLPEGIEHVEAFIEQAQAGVVIFDPVSDFVARGIDLNDEAAVRYALAPLILLAERKGLVVLCARHLRKSSEGKALYRVLGSGSFIQVPRSIMAVEQDPEHDCGRILLSLKSSYSKRPAPWRFRLTAGSNEVVAVTWGEQVAKEAEEAMSEAGDITPAKLNEARERLRALLKDGKADSKSVEIAMRTVGISDRTRYRAYREENVVKEVERDEKIGQFVRHLLSLPQELK